MIAVGYMFAPQKACHKKGHLKKSPVPNKQPQTQTSAKHKRILQKRILFPDTIYSIIQGYKIH